MSTIRKPDHGSSSTQFRQTLYLSAALRAACNQLQPNKRKPPKPESKQGQNQPNTKMTDEEIAGIRWDYEQGGYSLNALCEKWNITYERATGLTNYKTRTKVMPKQFVCHPQKSDMSNQP